MAKHKRIFPYAEARIKFRARTSENKQGDAIQIEATSDEFVNFGSEVGLEGYSHGGRHAWWTSIERGPMLDDLITALTFYQQKGYES